MGVNNAHQFLRKKGLDYTLLDWDVFLEAQTQPVRLDLLATFFWKIKVFLAKNDREGLARYLISRLNHANLIVYVDGAQSAQKSATSMKRVMAQERMLVKLEKVVKNVKRKTKLSKWIYKTTSKLKTSLYSVSAQDLDYIRNVLTEQGTG